jgi:hypothetical protein
MMKLITLLFALTWVTLARSANPYEDESAQVAMQNEVRRAQQESERTRAKAEQRRIEARQARIDSQLRLQNQTGQTKEAAKGSTAERIAAFLTDPDDSRRKVLEEQRRARLREGVEELQAARAEAARIGKMQPKIPNDPRLAQSSAYFAATRSGQYTDSAGRTQGESGGVRDPEKIAGWAPDPQEKIMEDRGFDIVVD